MRNSKGYLHGSLCFDTCCSFPPLSVISDLQALRRLLSSATPILKAETERRYHAFRYQKLTGKPLVPAAQTTSNTSGESGMNPKDSWAQRMQKHIAKEVWWEIWIPMFILSGFLFLCVCVVVWAYMQDTHTS
jgi:hypothetical protein